MVWREKTRSWRGARRCWMTFCRTSAGRAGEGLEAARGVSQSVEGSVGRARVTPLAVYMRRGERRTRKSIADFGFDFCYNLKELTETLDACFSHETVEEIIDSLENEAAKTNDPWCISTLKRLKDASPLSLKVSLRSIRQARFQTLDQCLIREYRMTVKGISKQITRDFSEGVRARLVDKDFAPKWDPPSLEQVSQDMVDQYFSPLNELGPELDLPTTQREAFM